MANQSKRRPNHSGHNHSGQNGVEPNKPEWNLSDFDLNDFLDLDLPQDEPLDWSDFEPLERPEVDMELFIRQLADEGQSIADEQLIAFSDLSQSDAAVVRAGWPDISQARRRWTVERLAELYAEELRINLERFWRIVLYDEDPQIRAGAIQGLAGEVYEDLVGAFVQMLINDPDEDVRAAAAAALGTYVLAGELDELDAAPAMRAEEALLDVLHNENEPLDVRCRALESIAFSGEVGVRQLIEDAYYADDEELRISAVIAMGRSADIRWRGKVCAELHNAAPEMRTEAAYACGELEAHDGLRDLIELLDDSDEEVRLASIFALGRLGGPEARAALEALAGAPESIESVAAEQALEEMQFFTQADAIPLFNELMDDLDLRDEIEEDLNELFGEESTIDDWDALFEVGLAEEPEDDFDSDEDEDELDDLGDDLSAGRAG